MAIKGNGREYDVTLKASAQVQTTTSQYLVVGIGGNTTSADYTCYLANNGVALNDTQAAYFAIGINQTGQLSASSEYCTVRMFGLSKAICASSISAGDFVIPYTGVSTTTRAGQIESIVSGTSMTVYGATITAHRVVLGRAFEDGSTNTVITIMVAPQLYDSSLIV